MELNVHDRIIMHPSAADIVAAVDAKPKGSDWFLTLDAGDGDSIEVTLDADGEYRLACEQKGQRFIARRPNDAKLKAVLIAYLARDQQWRSLLRWKEDRGVSAKPVAKTASSEPPVAAIIAVVASIAFIFIYAEMPDSWREALPFANSDFGGIFLVFLPMIVMVIALVVTKVGAAKKAASWPSAQGRITSSGMASKLRQFQGEAGTVINAPAIGYEFKTHGQRFTGTRIGIGEDTGGANSQATLKRYPVGAAVTVYYNPKDPSDCVLERDIPKDFAKGCLSILAMIGAVGGVIWSVIAFGPGLIDRYFPNAQTGAMLFAIGFGCALLLFFFASRKMSQRASHWPFVEGTVLTSVVESHKTWNSGRTTTTYRPVIEYAYEVGGSAYRSRQIQFGVTVEGPESYAQGVVARYPEGSVVEVHYDPDNPGSAALENPSGYNWLILAAAIFCFGVAVFAAHVFR